MQTIQQPQKALYRRTTSYGDSPYLQAHTPPCGFQSQPWMYMDTAWLSLVNTWEGFCDPKPRPMPQISPQHSREEEVAAADHSTACSHHQHACAALVISTPQHTPSGHSTSIHTVSRPIMTRRRVRHTVPPHPLRPTCCQQPGDLSACYYTTECGLPHGQAGATSGQYEASQHGLPPNLCSTRPHESADSLASIGMQWLQWVVGLHGSTI